MCSRADAVSGSKDENHFGNGVEIERTTVYTLLLYGCCDLLLLPMAFGSELLLWLRLPPRLRTLFAEAAAWAVGTVSASVPNCAAYSPKYGCSSSRSQDQRRAGSLSTQRLRKSMMSGFCRQRAGTLASSGSKETGTGSVTPWRKSNMI